MITNTIFHSSQAKYSENSPTKSVYEFLCQQKAHHFVSSKVSHNIGNYFIF